MNHILWRLLQFLGGSYLTTGLPQYSARKHHPPSCQLFLPPGREIKNLISGQMSSFKKKISTEFMTNRLTFCILLSSEFIILIRRTSFSALSSLNIQFKSSPKPTRHKIGISYYTCHLDILSSIW